MNILASFFLMAPPAGGSGSGSGLSTIILFGGILAVMYFFMIRPQQKKQNDAKKFLEGLQKGDKIVTVAGVHGRILKVNDNGTLEVEIDSNVKVIMERSGVSPEYTKAITEKK